MVQVINTELISGIPEDATITRQYIRNLNRVAKSTAAEDVAAADIEATLLAIGELEGLLRAVMLKLGMNEWNLDSGSSQTP